MGKDGKPSSIRVRVARVRKAFGRKMSVIKLILGTILVGLAATGLYLTF